MANVVFNRVKAELLNAGIDLLSNVIKASLHDSGYVEDVDDDFMDEAGANDPIDEELSGTGYVAGHGNSGRLTLASKAVAQDQANNRGEFDAADLTWTAIDAGTADNLILHVEGASNDTTADLIGHVDSGFPIVTNGGNLVVAWNAEGILQAA